MTDRDLRRLKLVAVVLSAVAEVARIVIKAHDEIAGTLKRREESAT